MANKRARLSLVASHSIGGAWKSLSLDVRKQKKRARFRGRTPANSMSRLEKFPGFPMERRVAQSAKKELSSCGSV